jgi:signal transduction histidine kinase
MGLSLPSGRLGYKVLYTGIEFSLLLVWVALGGHPWLLQFLYFIVVIRSCFLFELLGRWAVAGLVFSLVLIQRMQQAHSAYLPVPLREQEQFWLSQWLDILLFGVALLLVLQLVNTVLAQHQTQKQLSLVYEQLRQYALQNEELVKLRERNRMAHDLHDSLGHSLTALNIQLQSALKLWSIDLAQAQLFLAEAQQLGTIAMQEVRQSVSALRVDALEDQSLEALNKAVVEDFHQATGVLTSTSISLSTVLPREVVTTLYQIVQEALTNICKPAGTTQVQIQVSATTENVYLTIQGNGRRRRLDLNARGFKKMQGMRKRVADWRGHFHIETQPRVGYRITVELRLPEVQT